MALNLSSIMQTIPAAIIGLTVHEYAHAWMSWKLGDSTAKSQGRLSLNPLRHIDPLGLLLIVVAGFGWARPVIFDPRNLKQKNRDEILIALAGPFSNLLMGTALFILARFLFLFSFFNASRSGFQVVNLLIIWGMTNFGLAIFNLIPIPPLDGSHIYTTYLQGFDPVLTAKIYRYGTIVLLAIILIQNYTKIIILPIWPIVRALADFLLRILNFA